MDLARRRLDGFGLSNESKRSSIGDDCAPLTGVVCLATGGSVGVLILMWEKEAARDETDPGEGVDLNEAPRLRLLLQCAALGKPHLQAPNVAAVMSIW